MPRWRAQEDSRCGRGRPHLSRPREAYQSGWWRWQLLGTLAHNVEMTRDQAQALEKGEKIERLKIGQEEDILVITAPADPRPREARPVAQPGPPTYGF